MNRLLVTVAILIASAMMITGCSQSSPAANPTAKPVEPTKPAAAQQAAPTAQPTAAPAKKVDFPQNGRALTMVVPFAAGGSTDVAGRLVAAGLEKELGSPVQIVNKAGANSAVGTTDVSLAKPDGYTLLYTGMPTFFTSYLDPGMKSVYTHKSFEPVAQTMKSSMVLAVKADSPYKSVKDFVDAAKKDPEKIKIAVAGIRSSNHLATLALQDKAGIKLTLVHFDGSAPGVTALLGGHVDATSAQEADLATQIKGGQLRALAVMDSKESSLLPGVPTMESQGYKVYGGTTHCLALPAGTPKEIVDLMSAATKKVLANKELVDKLPGIGLAVDYLDSGALRTSWAQREDEVSTLLKGIVEKK